MDQSFVVNEKSKLLDHMGTFGRCFFAGKQVLLDNYGAVLQ